jgi:hypothetical protein
VCVCGISLGILSVHSNADILLFDTDLVFEFLTICPNLDWNSTSVSPRRVLSQWNSWGRHPGVSNGPNLDCPTLWRCHFCLPYPGELWMFHYHWACAGCSLYMVNSDSIPRGISNSWLWLAKASSCSFLHLIVETAGFRRNLLRGVSRILRDEPKKLLCLMCSQLTRALALLCAQSFFKRIILPWSILTLGPGKALPHF